MLKLFFNTETLYKEIKKEYEEKYDMLIMGNLRYNFLVERLTGKFGVKILENSSIPIFIA